MPNRSFSDRLYRCLLLLFPKELRRRYGPDMEQLFRDRRRHTGRKPLALGRLWLQAFLDIGTQASSEQVRSWKNRRYLETSRIKGGDVGFSRMRRWIPALKISSRVLTRSPGYAFVAVVTLGLGIGAATAVFTLVDGVLIQPLPFHEPEELVSIRHTARDGQDQVSLSDGLYLMYGELASSIDGVALYHGSEMSLLAGDEPEQVEVQVVTPSFFSVLEVPPAVGRTFLQEEELPDSEPVVVLSFGLWQRVFGADPGAVGQALELDGVSRTVVGVMPPDFGFQTRDAQAWLPYQVDPAEDLITNFSASGLARLAPGSSLESLNAEFQSLLDHIVEIYPGSGGAGFLADVNIQTANRPMKEEVVGDVDATLWILLGTVGLLLLIACANVANLLLVRAESRRRELAVRLAMGAGRGEVLRLFGGESLLLAGLGGILGLIMGNWALQISIRFIPADLPRVAEVGMDGRVLAFSALLTVGCALFCGLLPMARHRAENLGGPLRDGGTRGATSGGSRNRLRNGLVVLQVAMALVLLVGAGLMFRSFLALQRTNPGFDREGILTARITVPSGEVESWEETADLFRQLQERLAAQPGVESVGITRRVPLSGSVGMTTVNLEDLPEVPGGGYIVAKTPAAGPGYFQTMGIPVLEGRTFLPTDAADGFRAAVVSESFARRWWPNGSPLGRRLSGGGMFSRDWWEVVGVVGDVHQQRLDAEVEDMVYLPPIYGPTAEPRVMRAMDVVVKTTGNPRQILPVLRRELKELNPRIPLANPRTMEDVFNGATAQTSFTMAMLGCSAGIALLLGLVGIYGVVSYVVSLRTREIGVRMALGATASSVRKMVVFQGIRLALVGTLIGLMVAGTLSSVMASLLFGVNALDPGTYGAVALALLTVAGLASWLPAHRAAVVDPSRALREE